MHTCVVLYCICTGQCNSASYWHLFCLWPLWYLPVMKTQEIDEFKWHTFPWRSWIQCVSSYVSWGIIVTLLKFVCNSCKIAEEQENCWKNKKILASFVLLVKVRFTELWQVILLLFPFLVPPPLALWDVFQEQLF